MKTFIKTIPILLIISCFFIACEKETNKVSYLSGTYEISLNQTKQIPQDKASTSITVQSIVDSRCPINYNCVDQGNAVVKVRLEERNQDTTLDLCLGTCDTGDKTVTSRGVMYVLKLKNVTPYPTGPISIAVAPTQTATLEITRKQK